MAHGLGQMGKLHGVRALLARAGSAAAKFCMAREGHGVDQAEFEQIARDLNLSPPELYGLVTGRQVSAGSLEQCLAAEFAASPHLAKRLRTIERNHRASLRMSLPFAPCC